MKRNVCSLHINYVRNNKSANLSVENCSICKRETKIGPLRLANLFKTLAFDLEFSYENPHYDPHGICIQNSAEAAFEAYFKLIHPAYSKPLIQKLKGIVEKHEQH